MVRPGAAMNRSTGWPNRSAGATVASAGPPHWRPIRLRKRIADDDDRAADVAWWGPKAVSAWMGRARLGGVDRPYASVDLKSGSEAQRDGSPVAGPSR